MPILPVRKSSLTSSEKTSAAATGWLKHTRWEDFGLIGRPNDYSRIEYRNDLVVRGSIRSCGKTFSKTKHPSAAPAVQPITLQTFDEESFVTPERPSAGARREDSSPPVLPPVTSTESSAAVFANSGSPAQSVLPPVRFWRPVALADCDPVVLNAALEAFVGPIASAESPDSFADRANPAALSLECVQSGSGLHVAFDNAEAIPVSYDATMAHILGPDLDTQAGVSARDELNGPGVRDGLSLRSSDTIAAPRDLTDTFLRHR